MTHIIIDRRKNSKGKSTDNRQRFMKRVKQQIKESVKKTIRDGEITDITKKDGSDVTISSKKLSRPKFKLGQGGIRDIILPGNKEFTQGDKLPRPKKGGDGKGNGRGSSNSGEGEDEFHFTLTKQEFLDMFFEDLALPDLTKKSLVQTDEWAYKRAGFSVDGTPNRLNVLRSMKMARGRLMALRVPKHKQIRLLKEEQAQSQLLLDDDPDNQEIKQRLEEIEKRLAYLTRKLKAIPFIDDIDLRYNRWEKFAVPSTQAVMFAIMDVSGSMDEWKKEMAKRFFILLYLFLERHYERTDIVFIRHHTVAREVDEKEFFYSRESGGTIVSSGLEKMLEIVKDRYSPTQWNIYACQASDGDDWPEDLPSVTQMMEEQVLPLVQYYAYVEIRRTASDAQWTTLWPIFTKIAETNKRLATTIIDDVTKIFEVFRGLFQK